MVKVKEEILNERLVKHYAEDSNGVLYKIKQIETGIIYDSAIDFIPCRYTYKATSQKVEQENSEVEE